MKAKKIFFSLMTNLVFAVFFTTLVFANADVFIKADGKELEMDYVAGFTKNMTSLYAFGLTPKTKFAIIVKGESAQLKIKDRSPVFLTKIHPSEIGIVRFNIDTYNKQKVRYVMRVGDFFQTQNQAAGPSENDAEFDFKKQSDGQYKITLKNSLDKGEYGIIVSSTNGQEGTWTLNSKYKIYDFTIE